MGMQGTCSSVGRGVQRQRRLPGGSCPLSTRRHGRLHRLHHDGELPAQSVPQPRQHACRRPSPCRPDGGGATASGNPSTGGTIFVNLNLDGGVFSCNLCHALPTGATGNLFNGQLEGETQDFKIPHLRNMYEKVGFDVIRPDCERQRQQHRAAHAEAGLRLHPRRRGQPDRVPRLQRLHESRPSRSATCSRSCSPFPTESVAGDRPPGHRDHGQQERRHGGVDRSRTLVGAGGAPRTRDLIVKGTWAASRRGGSTTRAPTSSCPTACSSRR